jgi:glycosyltransferase involved in cell wall biosynthesis
VPRKRALMGCSNYWDSPFQVGSQHLARALVRAGYDVAYLSDPISPMHLCRGWTADLQQRLAIYRTRGRHDLDGHLWTYVPAAWLTPHNKPLLRSRAVMGSWHRWTWPNLAALVAARGFAEVDLLYIDSMHQSCWLDSVRYRRSVYRVPDFNPHFEKYTPAAAAAEQEMAQRVDLVVYPSHQLHTYVEALGARRSLLLANGVDHAHFAGAPLPCPPEYRALSGPIAVYVGVIPDWFHFDWIRQAAIELPEMTFVLIGPDRLARERLSGLANVHPLGVRPYATLPSYLQHAHVGLMPFNVEINPRGVEVLQPQKLLAYFASGLPVVSSDWKNLRELDSPADLCASADQFVDALRRATTTTIDTASLRGFAARFNWDRQTSLLLEQLDAVAFPRSAAAA